MKSEMLEDVISALPPQEEFSIEGISSPIMLEFCDDDSVDFFLDNLETSDLPASFVSTSCSTRGIISTPTASSTVTTGSNGGQFCYVDSNPFTFDPATVTYGSNQPDIISTAGAAATYQYSPVTPVIYNQEQYFHQQALSTDAIADDQGYCYSSFDVRDSSTVQIPMGPPPGQLQIMASDQYEYCSAMLQAGYGGGFEYPTPPSRSYYDPDAIMGKGFFSRAMMMIGMEPEMVADPVPETVSVYSSGDMQMRGDCQSLVGVSNSSSAKSLPTTDISALDNVCRLTAEQRKEKIDRYLKKRNERNFNKKIKYACRKTLADNRPRVRGRFAKNDELSEATVRAGSNNPEYDDYDVGVKEDQDVLSSDPNTYQWRELLEIQLLS